MWAMPAELRFAKSHEWACLEPDRSASVGISDYAQQALGDVVFVEQAEVGKVVAAGDAAGAIESTKAASELFAPIGGEVTTVNEALTADPDLLNEHPYGSWIFRLRPSNKDELDKLLDAAGYKAAFGED